MDRQLALISGEPWTSAARPAAHQSWCLLLPRHRCCFRLCLYPAWCGGFPQSLRTKEGRDLCYPVIGAGVVTWAGASAIIIGAGCLCLALSGRAPLRCRELEGGIATSYQDTGFGVELSHGLLLAKVCWGGGSIPKPPHSSSLECEVTPNPLGLGTLWTRLPLLGQDKRCWEEHGCESPVSQEIKVYLRAAHI